MTPATLSAKSEAMELLYQLWKNAEPASRPRAADALFGALYTYVRGIVYQFRGVDDVDLVQDVLMRVHTQLPAFKGESALSSWVYVVAKHASDRKFRSPEKPSVSLDDIASHEASLGLGEHVSRLVLDDLLQKASLSGAERHLALMKREGLSDKEIAPQLGCQRNVVKLRWSRLKRKLREAGA